MVKSAGILLFRFTNKIPEVFIVHPGGPFWKKKDAGAWTIPKGEFSDEEKPLDAALREFEEETGHRISGKYIPMTPVKLKSGKIIYAFAFEHDLDASRLNSNTYSMEWPPKSGQQQEFPEIDRGEWFDTDTARVKLNPAQVALVNELVRIISSS